MYPAGSFINSTGWPGRWSSAAAVGIAVLAAPALRAEWQQIYSASFNSPRDLEEWHLDGSAEVTVTPQRELRITTRQIEIDGVPTAGSVLWCKRPFWGDIRIRFRCRAERDTRGLFFFNARSTAPDKSIFGWSRPHAFYGDYAYEPRLELYTVGVLRNTETNINLRHLGGDVMAEWMRIMPYPPHIHPARYLTPEELASALTSADRRELPGKARDVQRLASEGEFRRLLEPHVRRWREVNERFQKASILANHDSQMPVFGDIDHVYEVQITSVGHDIEVKVDGKTIVDHSDKAREEAPLRGGYLGFRNFRATTTWYSDLSVERLQ